MRFFEMGLAFASIAFVVVGAVLGLLTVLIWRVAGASFRRSGALFALRMLPAIGSLGLVLGLVVPAFWAFEPRITHERAGVALAFVLVAGFLVMAGVYRMLVSWLHTRRLERLWRAAAVRSADLGIPVHAYRVPSDRPFAALVGVLRPRLFVSDRFLDALSADERQAVLDHEAGHLLSLDNLKRVAMKAAPDWLAFSPVGRQIESAWAMAAEEQADDHAAGPGGRRSLELAGALLKASRLMPLRCAAVSNFCDGATIARRVERLLAGPLADRPASRAAAWRWSWVPVLLAAAALLAGPSLRVAYELTESAVRLLR